MNEEINNRLKEWLTFNNHDELDDERLYNLVVSLHRDILERTDFDSAALEIEEETGNAIGDDTLDDAYFKYECISGFYRWKLQH